MLSLMLQKVFALVLAVCGLALAIGGFRLAASGGSAYYVIVGPVFLASALLLWGRRLEGIYLYVAAWFGTVAWSVWEVGFQTWPLLSRLGMLTAFGLWLMLPSARRGMQPLYPRSPFSRRRSTGAVALVLSGCLVLAVSCGWLLRAFGDAPPDDPVFQAGTRGPSDPVPPTLQSGPLDWPHYGNDPGGSRFSKAAQITTRNVDKLEVAWTYRTGPAPAGYLTFEATPLKIDDTLYFCTGYNDVIALDADTGREKWRYRAQVDSSGVAAYTCRGVGYYRLPGAAGECARRVFTNTVDARLIALDARDGQPCSGFGDQGSVSLLAGMGEVIPGHYYVTSAPTVVAGRIVLGGWVADGQYWGEPSGVIRAFDAVTGELAWAFDAGRPDRRAEPPQGEHYTRATPNSWAPMSADEELGLVYVPTGNATPDYYGAQRRSFDDRYSSSVLALDVRTGEIRWSFQTVHHDLWDYDVGSQPTLVDLATAQGVRKALLQPTKRGEVFVLDRVTGEPIMPVEERPAPQSGAPDGERLSPTQPFPVGMPSFRGPDLEERSMWGLTPLDQLWCRIRFRDARYEGPFTPVGEYWTLVYPGFSGGHNWGGVSVELSRNIMVATSNRLASYNRLVRRPGEEAVDERDEPLSKLAYGNRFIWPQKGTPYIADTSAFFSPLGVPCQQPPYGLITAVDLGTGKVAWHRPLGTVRDSGPLGIPLGLKITVGTPNAGGAITTAGGVTFVAASIDGYLRAYDTGNGDLLWEARLPAGGQATPMTYVSQGGRQMVVIAAGGMAMMQTRTGDHLVAFALPPEE